MSKVGRAYPLREGRLGGRKKGATGTQLRNHFSNVGCRGPLQGRRRAVDEVAYEETVGRVELLC
jgi:hypothetical protein